MVELKLAIKGVTITLKVKRLIIILSVDPEVESYENTANPTVLIFPIFRICKFTTV